jgi:hypothetical protein
VPGSLKQEVAQPIRRAWVVHVSQQREAAPVTTDRELSGRESDVSSLPVATFPDCEPDQLEAIEFATGEVEFDVRELGARTLSFVADDFHERVHNVPSC